MKEEEEEGEALYTYTPVSHATEAKAEHNGIVLMVARWLQPN